MAKPQLQALGQRTFQSGKLKGRTWESLTNLELQRVAARGSGGVDERRLSSAYARAQSSPWRTRCWARPWSGR